MKYLSLATAVANLAIAMATPITDQASQLDERNSVSMSELADVSLLRAGEAQSHG